MQVDWWSKFDDSKEIVVILHADHLSVSVTGIPIRSYQGIQGYLLYEAERCRDLCKDILKAC